MQERVALLILHAGRVLLVHRIKEGREYYVLPGGGVEAGETLEEACLREAREETGLTVTLGEKLGSLVNQGRTEHFFLTAGFKGELQLGGPERERQSDANQYHPEWVDAGRLEGIHLVPPEAVQLCREWAQTHQS